MTEYNTDEKTIEVDLGGDTISVDLSAGGTLRHGASHEAGGSDPIQIEELEDIGGDVSLDTGELIIDYSEKEIPAAVLGGPAGQLSAYPIENSDIANSFLNITEGKGITASSSQPQLGGNLTLTVDVSDFAGDGLEDDGSGNLRVLNGGLTLTAGDGIDGAGFITLGGSTSISVDVSDFAGAGLQDDGSNNLELINDSVTVTAGNQLTGGGAVALGGTITLNVDESGLDADTLDGFEADELGVDISEDGTAVVSNATDANFQDGFSVGAGAGSSANINFVSSDVAGSGLQDDGSNNLELINDSVTVTAGNQLTGGGSVALGGSITIDLDEGPGSGLDADTVDGFEASELGVDISNNGATVTSNATDLDFDTGLTASDDGDSTATAVLDENYAATWTSIQTFEADIEGSFGKTLYDQSSNWIPLTALEEDNFNVSTGDGLKGGGSALLGGTVTLNIDVSDFAGAGLVDDGSENLDVNTGTGVEISGDTVQIDQAFNPTWTGNHTFNGSVTHGTDVDYQNTYLPINLPAPVDADDAARKQYVDNTAAGATDVKESVTAATDGANVDLASATDPNPIDGVTLTDGQRVLLKNQTDATENGIYVATTATDPTTWTRSSDADEDSEFTSGLFAFVEEGTENGNSSWIVTTPDPITLGVTSITFAQFSAAGEITAGDGLSKTGQTLNINVSDFAGTYLSDDGSENLTVDLGRGLENDGSGNIQFDEDTSYEFTQPTTSRYLKVLPPGDSTSIGFFEDRPFVVSSSDANQTRPFVENTGSGDAQFSFADNGSTQLSIGWRRADNNLVFSGSFDLNSSSAEVFTADLSTKDVTIPNGNILDGAANIIYDQSNNWVPQARLENDSVTVTAGDSLTGGGAVALGSSITINLGTVENTHLQNDSVTVNANDGIVGGGTVALGGTIGLNIEPADFAGTFLSDDGADNLTVDLGVGVEDDGSGNIRLDEDYAASWSTEQTFSAGLNSTGDIRDSAQTIWDSTGQEIPDSALGSIDNATLTNSSITITAGANLSGGGSVSLGGSTTLNVDTAGLDADSVDGYEGAELGVLAEAETVTSTWTFSSGLDSGGAIDLTASSAIQDAGVDAIQFDGSQNVTIPNGDLTLLSGNTITADSLTLRVDPGFVLEPAADCEAQLESTGGADASAFNFQFFDNDAALQDISWSRDSAGNAFEVYNIGGSSYFQVQDTGDVSIPNGALDMGSNAITSVADPTNAQDAATKNYVDNNAGGGGGASFSFSPGHQNYADGLTNEEFYRIDLAAGEQLEVHRLETRLKGGGTNANFTVDVYDETAATVLASTDSLSTGSPIDTSGAGNAVIVRVSNSTGSDQDASITARFIIV